LKDFAGTERKKKLGRKPIKEELAKCAGLRVEDAAGALMKCKLIKTNGGEPGRKGACSSVQGPSLERVARRQQRTNYARRGRVINGIGDTDGRRDKCDWDRQHCGELKNFVQRDVCRRGGNEALGPPEAGGQSRERGPGKFRRGSLLRRKGNLDKDPSPRPPEPEKTDLMEVCNRERSLKLRDGPA